MLGITSSQILGNAYYGFLKYLKANILALYFLCTTFFINGISGNPLPGSVENITNPREFSLLRNQTTKKQNETEEEAGDAHKPRVRFLLNYYNVFNVDQCEGIGEGFYTPQAQTAANYILERSGMKHLKLQHQEKKQPEPETIAA